MGYPALHNGGWLVRLVLSFIAEHMRQHLAVENAVGTLVAAAIPAEARLSHPTIGGPISDGFFQGMPVRVEARARLSELELTGVAGANCYVLRQVVHDRLGASFLRTVRICE